MLSLNRHYFFFAFHDQKCRCCRGKFTSLLLIHAERLKHVAFSVSDNDRAPPGGSAKTVWWEAGESFGECLLINLPKDAEGRT